VTGQAADDSALSSENEAQRQTNISTIKRQRMLTTARLVTPAGHLNFPSQRLFSSKRWVLGR
jgi:hypothetical protein